MTLMVLRTTGQDLSDVFPIIRAKLWLCWGRSEVKCHSYYFISRVHATQRHHFLYVCSNVCEAYQLESYSFPIAHTAFNLLGRRSLWAACTYRVGSYIPPSLGLILYIVIWNSSAWEICLFFLFIYHLLTYLYQYVFEEVENMPLWLIDYSEPKALKKQQIQKELSDFFYLKPGSKMSHKKMPLSVRRNSYYQSTNQL